jgi:hypothetical protein
MRKCEKYCRAGQATHDNMAHAHCMLNIKSYKRDTQNMKYLLLFHGSNGCTVTPLCYVIRILPVLLIPHAI